MEKEYWCIHNNGVTCPLNTKGKEYERDCACKRCGWNPPVANRRKAKITAMLREKEGVSVRMRCKGITLTQDDYVPTLMTVKITTDSCGSSLSIGDDRIGMQFIIPLEVVHELEVKNG